MWLAGVAALALAIGAAVYLTDRAAGSAALIPAGLHVAAGHRFGPLGQWLPSFVHPFAFALLTAAVARPGPRAAYGACALWWLLDVGAEIAQHPGLRDAMAGPLLAMASVPPGGLLAAYVRHGTFDPGDLAAATLGAAAAALTLRAFSSSPAPRLPEAPHAY